MGGRAASECALGLGPGLLVWVLLLARLAVGASVENVRLVLCP